MDQIFELLPKLPYTVKAMRLRQAGVNNIRDVKTAVLEASGQLSVVLKEENRYATKKDLQKISDQLILINQQLIDMAPQQAKVVQPEKFGQPSMDMLFAEATAEDQQDKNISTH